MSLLRTALGAVLRRLRLAQGRTLQDVAETAGVSLPYLSEIERGRKEISSELLASICRALGIGLPELLEQVRLELLRTAPVAPPRCTTASRPTARKATGRPTARKAPSRPGFRTPRLAACHKAGHPIGHLITDNKAGYLITATRPAARSQQ